MWTSETNSRCVMRYSKVYLDLGRVLIVVGSYTSVNQLPNDIVMENKQKCNSILSIHDIVFESG